MKKDSRASRPVSEHKARRSRSSRRAKFRGTFPWNILSYFCCYIKALDKIDSCLQPQIWRRGCLMMLKENMFPLDADLR